MIIFTEKMVYIFKNTYKMTENILILSKKNTLCHLFKDGIFLEYIGRIKKLDKLSVNRL